MVDNDHGDFLVGQFNIVQAGDMAMLHSLKWQGEHIRRFYPQC